MAGNGEKNMDTSNRTGNGEKNMRIRLVIGSLIALVAVAPSRGETPLGTAFTYQGQLKEGGAPLEGTADFEFTLWDAAGSGNPPTGGAQIGGMQAISAVQVTSGLFTAALNSASEFGVNAFNGNARWVQIAVRSPASDGLFTTLAPRQPLTAAPHALLALNADRLDGLDSAAFLQSVPNPLTLSGTNATHIIRGENTSTANDAVGIFGLSSAASGNTYGLSGESNSTSGRGVYGQATAASGTTYGVYGDSDSPSGYGGFFTAPGLGVSGSATAVTGTTTAGRFESASADGRGVLGLASATSGFNYGVRGQSNSTDGRGVYGLANAASGTTYGVSGDSNSPNGFGGYFTSPGLGVYGSATAVTGTTHGGAFDSASANGRGVSGLASAATGDTYP